VGNARLDNNQGGFEMSKETLEAWTAGFKEKYPLGYSQYQLNYITGHASEIQKQAIQLEMIWANINAFKSDIDVQEAIINKVKEIKKTIGYLEGYLKSTKEEGE
jgi:hypothetical protein